ncbi:MAG: ImmA/IrrE family metallo-endopeptidase [Gammaproteobacteria bacterium]|nr:ImmA/IrrE family metallo-endopeptidase [Gammaproteobacteria bacterium]
MNESAIGAKHANRVTKVLDHALGVDRFPVKVKDVALEISRLLYPNDRIETAIGDKLPGFDGALIQIAPDRGWAIVFNDGIASAGRINFTLAHEFGHYLMHRAEFPEGFNCNSSDIARQDSDYRRIELDANTFAAYLLMPFRDFRRQLDPKEKPSWERLSQCAERYDVSLLAVTLRWLEYTSLSAALVISKDGFIDWGKSSRRAFKSGFYFAKRFVTPVPEASPASNEQLMVGRIDPVQHPPGVWFRERVTEAVIRSDNYDFTMSLLITDDEPRLYKSDDDEELSELSFPR